jgi:hypothetical protein
VWRRVWGAGAGCTLERTVGGAGGGTEAWIVLPGAGNDECGSPTPLHP